MDADGTAETIVEVPQQPSGLGWLPDGRMLVVSMLDRRVMRLEPTVRSSCTPISPTLAPGLVQRHGRRRAAAAPTSATSASTCTRATSRAETCLIAVEPDGRARVVADGLAFPNGTVITPDGATLIVGESMASRITAFDIGADGTLANRRVWATLEGATVDGMCLDAEGAIWAACPFTGRVLRIREGGEIIDEVKGTHPGRVRVHARRRRSAHALRVHCADACARRGTCCA